MWEAQIDGRPLKFHLAGINNQNFIMRDEETGSWWQQVTGAALHGPQRGKQLKAVFCDEVSFGAWQREHPNGRVLRPDERTAAQYERADWEARYARLPVVTPVAPTEPWPPRTLIVGVTLNGADKAYPLDDLRKQRLIIDTLGGAPLFLVVAEDGQSVRAFERNADGHTLEFFVKAATAPLLMVDAETGTTWDFSGQGVAGALAGRQLRRVAVRKDYWFDWQIYHPRTGVYTLGARLNP